MKPLLPAYKQVGERRYREISGLYFEDFEQDFMKRLYSFFDTPRLTKRLLNDGLQSTLEQAVNHEAMAQVDNLGSADATEARDAFLQRRPAKFTGGWTGR